MENNYKIFLGIEPETRKIFEKNLISEGYQIIETEEKEILFTKKSAGVESEEYLKAEQIAKRMLIGIIKKYLGRGFIYIDFSKDMKKIIDNLMENNYNFKTDNRITWRIRQAITKAIIDKNKTGEREYGGNHTTN